MANGNFWANKVRTPQPVQQPQTVAQQGPWWLAPPVEHSHPTSNIPAMVEQPLQTKARSARLTDSCPECQSGNYFAIGGAKARCYDCGYPVIQQFSGVGMPSGQGEVAGQAKQLSAGHVVHSNDKGGYLAGGQTQGFHAISNSSEAVGHA